VAEVVVAQYPVMERLVLVAALAVADKVIMPVHTLVAQEHPVKEMLAELALILLFLLLLTEQQVVVVLVQ
jgi:hypothetical protein